MRAWQRVVVALVAGAVPLSVSIGAAKAGSLYLGGAMLGGGTAVSLQVESLQQRKFAGTVEQKYDFSCGSAALATMLSYSYGLQVAEQPVFKSMFDHGDKKVIEQAGFSLLDMKQYLARHGLPSGGFRAPLSKLAAVGVPAIALIDVRGYHHFVVIEGIRDGKVLLADPATGLRSLPVKQFEAQWSGIFFLILTDVEQARRGFNNPERWAAAPRTPDGLTRFAVDMATLAQPALINQNRF